VFDTHKTRIIGLPCCEKNYNNILSRFHRIPAHNGRTDGQSELLREYYADTRLKKGQENGGHKSEGNGIDRRGESCSPTN